MKTNPSPTSDTPQAVEKPAILIVDDSRVMRVALRKILEDEYKVIEAGDGEEGWLKLQEQGAIRIVFSDLSMPGLDGFGLLERIRNADSPVRDLPFIVITGHEDSEGTREKALKQGATDLVSKPFQSIEIRARASAHIQSQSKLSAASAALEESSTSDAITGLSNQRHFLQCLKEHLSFAVRHRNELAVLLLQLDGFDRIESAHDAEFVAYVLQEVGDLLRAHLRTEDAIAHWGHGKFSISLPATNDIGAKHLAKRILADVEAKKLFSQGQPLGLTMSIGLVAPDVGKDGTSETVLKIAERRLATARSTGGNRIGSDDPVKLQQAEPRTEARASPPAPKAQPAALDGARDEELQRLRTELAAAQEEAKAAKETQLRFEQQMAKLRAIADAAAQRAESEARLRQQAEAGRQTAEQKLREHASRAESMAAAAAASTALQHEIEQAQKEAASLRQHLTLTEESVAATKAQLEGELNALRTRLQEALDAAKAEAEARQDAENAARSVIEARQEETGNLRTQLDDALNRADAAERERRNLEQRVLELEAAGLAPTTAASDAKEQSTFGESKPDAIEALEFARSIPELADFAPAEADGFQEAHPASELPERELAKMLGLPEPAAQSELTLVADATHDQEQEVLTLPNPIEDHPRRREPEVTGFPKAPRSGRKGVLLAVGGLLIVAALAFLFV